jgi:hypothetical protein
MKKNYFLKLILIATILICFQQCALNRRPASNHLPEMFSSIKYEKFEARAAKALISSPISLKIDTTSEDKIVAYEFYEGELHRKWIFGETRWIGKTVYIITYQKEIDGVSYKIEINSFEAPSKDYLKWKSINSSEMTKENLIIQKLN